MSYTRLPEKAFSELAVPFLGYESSPGLQNMPERIQRVSQSNQESQGATRSGDTESDVKDHCEEVNDNRSGSR